MAEYTEEELFDMSDEDLEAAYKEAKAEDVPDEQDSGVDEEDEVVEDEPEEEEDEATDDEEEDLEQPDDQDSDDDGEEEDGEDETEEDSEEEELTDPEEEEQPTEEEAKPTEEAQPVQKLKYKANGKEFEFTEKEVQEQFGKVFAQAANYTQKMQAIAPYKKMISAMDDENITEQDMNLMIDVLKGDKDAIASVLKRTGVDALDLDMEQERDYQPNSYGRNETELAIQDIVNDISRDPEYQVTQHVIESQWDNKSRDIFVENPALIRELHTDVANGVFDKVSPMALKMKVIDGGKKADIEYYVEAGRQYYQEKQREEARLRELDGLEAKKAADKAAADKLSAVKKAEDSRKATKQASKKRRAAAPTKSRAGKKSVKDYLDDSDEAFDEWYKNLEL